MNAQEIIQYIAQAEKKTPVKLYIKENAPVDYGSAKVFGAGDKIVFGDWRELGEEYYSIGDNTITLKKDLLHVGENALKIESAGYKPQTVKFAYNKVNETGLSLSVANTAAGEPVVITVENSNGDFLSHLKSVTLTSNGKDDAVYRQDVEGGDAVYYEIAEDNKSLTLHNVKPGTYTVKIAAEYYDDALTKEFTMDGTVEVTI